MPNESDHIALANKNHDALFHLIASGEKFPEWITTIAFYKAVQLVEAVFSNQPGEKNCSNHPERLAKLKMHPYTTIFKHFRALYSASTVARYLHDNTENTAYTSFADFLPPEKVIEKMVFKRLRSVEQSCIQFLSDPSKRDLTRIPSN